jgi:hypothetical protein
MSEKAATPGVQQMLADDSALPEVPFGKTVWKFGRPDEAARGRLEKLVKKVAIGEVRALKDTLDPAAYAELFEARTRSLKRYDTWRDGWQAVVFDPANSHLFLWSLLQANHPDVAEADVLALAKGAPEEVLFALAQVMPDFFRALLAGMELTPDQQRAVDAALASLRERLTPTRASTSTSSATPTPPSPKSRSATARGKSPA